MPEIIPEIKTRVAYRPLMVQVLGEMLEKYKGLTSYEVACKLMVQEELLILKKDTQPLNDRLNNLDLAKELD